MKPLNSDLKVITHAERASTSCFIRATHCLEYSLTKSILLPFVKYTGIYKTVITDF